SIDGETGEAMCSEVNPTTDPASPDYLHGLGSSVSVTDVNGDSYTIDCSKRIVVGNFIGAQMAAFNVNNELGLIEHIQDWDTNSAEGYLARTVVVGGIPPYSVTLTNGALPTGLSLDPTSGILSQSGNPVLGTYNFTLQVSDTSPAPQAVTKSYTVRVGDPNAAIQYPLQVGKTGNGSGLVSGANGEINCDPICSAWLTAGTQVTLQATPAVGSQFSGWSLAACPGATPCNVTMDGDKRLSASFTLQQFLLSVSKSGTGSGTVTGNGINCGNLCSLTLDYATAVVLTATPTAGSQLASWSGCTTSTATSCSTTMSAARDITATFNTLPTSYKVTVSLSGLGSVTSSPKGISCGKTCSKSFTTGSTVTLTATPARKHTFVKWTGTVCNNLTSTKCTVPITQDQTLVATFN
ncbi:MAG: InlB B-repeat-containing protein, partial [Aeromonadaceae bacterium]